MLLPQIRMQSTFIQQGLNIIEPAQRIEQPQAEMSIRQPKGDLKIKTQPGKLSIDASQCRKDVGLLTNKGVMERYASEGNQAVLEGMTRRVQEGNQLMKIENGFTAIQDIARNRLNEPYVPVWMDFIPKYGSLKMSYEPAKVEIDYKANKPEIKVTPKKAIHTYTPGKVEGTIIRKNNLDISFVNLYA